MAAASPVFALGGYPALGGASAAACVLAAAIATTLPEHRRQQEVHGSGGLASFAGTISVGVSEVAHTPRLRSLVIFAIAVTTVWGVLDEYVPLLAIDSGFTEAEIPLLALVVYVGVAAGGLLGGVGHRFGRSLIAGLLALAGVTTAAGALFGDAVGFGLIGLAFCVFQMTQIAADAHIQDTTSGAARSTVTSVAGFGSAISVIATYAIYGAGTNIASHAQLFVIGAAAYVLLGIAVANFSR
jgi:hypothetical protein